MKRFLIAIPIILFVLLNACSNNAVIPPSIITAVVQSLTATMLTPTVSATPMYMTELSMIDGNLNIRIENNEISSKFEQLEHAIGNRYQVIDVNLLQENGIANTLEVVVSCECPLNNPCCTRERAFVKTMMAMDAYRDIVWQVPPTVTRLLVKCLDHNDPMGEVYVSWDAVKSFLTDSINGYQLASQVTNEP